MKRLLNLLLPAFLLMGWSVLPSVAAPAKAICIVCKAKGETEEEPVKAVRTYEGNEYAFCSEKCAEEFTAEPATYLPAPFPRNSPEFSVTGLDGRAITNESLSGKVVLIDFWATWCAPCRKSMPELQALHEKYGERGFQVVGISIDEGGPAKVKKLIKSKKLTYPIAMDSEKNPAWDAFRVKAVPAAFLMDRKGQIVAQWTGASANATQLETKLEDLLRAD